MHSKNAPNGWSTLARGATLWALISALSACVTEPTRKPDDDAIKVVLITPTGTAPPPDAAATSEEAHEAMLRLKAQLASMLSERSESNLTHKLFSRSSDATSTAKPVEALPDDPSSRAYKPTPKPTSAKAPAHTTPPTSGEGSETPPPPPPPVKPPEPELKKAAIAWNTPPTMQVGDSKPVELLVTMDAERMANIAERLASPGDATTETVDLSRQIEATLDESEAFKISPKEPQISPILAGRDTKFVWTITSLKPGNDLPLVLHIRSKLAAGNFDEPIIRTIRVTAKPVPVPTWSEQVRTFIANYWQWLIVTLILPFGKWIYSATRQSKPAG